MRFVKQPNRWSCAAAATASLLDLPLQQVLDGLGHDGSEIIDPNARFPTCYKGYPMEEIIDYCLTEGVGLVQLSAMPNYTTNGENEFELWPEDVCLARMKKYMDIYDGLLVGPSLAGMHKWHVVAWDAKKQQCYDSAHHEGVKVPTITVAYFYIALRLNSKKPPTLEEFRDSRPTREERDPHHIAYRRDEYDINDPRRYGQ